MPCVTFLVSCVPCLVSHFTGHLPTAICSISLILILIFIDLFSPNGALWVKTNHKICSGYIAHYTCFSLDNQLAVTYNTHDSNFKAVLLECCS